MAENVYLKTVNFGGFDKKETLTYIDTLLSDIYRLEAEVKEKDEMISALEKGGEVKNFAGKEELEAKIDEGKSKISELQASTDTLKLQIANYESDVTEKDQKISELQNEIEDLKEKLENAESNGGGGGMADFDLGSVFVEAKKTADKVVVEAKKAAKKMEDDATELQNQILEDANTQAASIVENAKAQAENTISSANAQAEKTISSANAQAESTLAKANAQAQSTIANANAEAEAAVTEALAKADSALSNAKKEAAVIREKSADLRNSVKAEYTALEANVTKLSEIFRDLFGDNMVRIDTTKELVDEGLALVSENSNFNNDLKGSDVSGKGNNTEKKSKHKTEAAEKPKEKPKSEKIEKAAKPDEEAQKMDEIAKLIAEAQAQADAIIEKERLEAQLAQVKAAEEEKKPSTYSKSFDLDMLSALTSQIQANNDKDGNLSDEEILKKWNK